MNATTDNLLPSHYCDTAGMAAKANWLARMTTGTIHQVESSLMLTVTHVL